MVAYVCMVYSLLDHVPHDYSTLDTRQNTSHCMCTFYDTNGTERNGTETELFIDAYCTYAWFVYASGLQYMFIGTLLFITGPEDCSPLCQCTWSS